jgi:hypothetical protein
VGAPDLAYVSFGPAGWDDCCGDANGKVGGQLTVAIGNVIPTRNFPLPLIQPTECVTPYAVPLVVELVRCAPTTDENGQLDLAASIGPLNELMDDGWRSLRALQCALAEDTRRWDGIITGLNPFPEQGGCHGWTIGLTISLFRWASDG